MAPKIIFILLFLPSLALANPAEVSKTVLDNGLTVLISELPASEVVSIYSCVKTGSAMEGKSLGKGISHFVEHMLFKGTAKRPVGAIAKEVKSLGGVINASTSHDYTIYTLDLPKEAFARGLDIASDMLMNSTFDATEMERERKVIHGEVALYNDRPDRMLSNLVFRNVYNHHPYRHPVIGYSNLLDSITHEEITAYYKERYIPNNIIISIAGPFKAGEILPLVKEAFKDFKPAAYVMRNLPSEPTQTFKRHLEKEYVVSLIKFSLAYQGVSVFDSDLYALDVLSMALGQGQGSRLYKRLYKDKRLVESVSSSNFTPEDRGIFEIEGDMTKDNLQEVLEVTQAVIRDIQSKGLSKLELDKTKRQVSATFVFGNQAAPGLAYRAAIDEAITSDANFSRHYVELIKKVSNEDIKRVAQRYLQDSRLSVTVLRPKAPTTAAVVPDIKKEGIHKIVLDNGLTILLHEDHSVLMAEIRLLMKGGRRLEDPHLAGITSLTGSIWAKGTTHLSQDKINEAMDIRGGHLSSSASFNTMEMEMTVLSEDLDFAVNLLEDLVKHPSFSLDVMERQRKNMITSLDERKDDIMSLSSRALIETLYLEHPMAKDSLGTKESLARITRRDIVQFYNHLLASNHMVISVFGSFDTVQVLDVLKKKFGSLKPQDLSFPAFQEAAPVAMRVKELQMDKQQGLLMMAFQAPHLKDKDRFGMEIISNLLGGGLGGRLFVKIREELGQAYTTSAHYSPDLDSGTFMLYVLTKPEKIDSVKALVMKELEKLGTEPISPEELQALQAYLKGSKVRSLLTNGALASRTATDEMLGLGYDFYQQFNSQIDAVTASDIQRLANTYLDVSKTAMTITTPIETKGHE